MLCHKNIILKMDKQKRGNKTVLLSALFLFAFMFSIISVSALTDANVTLVAPASSATISGASVVLNASIDSAPSENWTSATFYAKSSSTANSSWTSLGTFSNNSVTILNGTFDSTTLEDSNDYTFNVTISNGTDTITATTNSVVIDNTVPQTPTLSPSSNNANPQTTSTTQTFTATVTGENTTSCIYTIYRGGSSSDGDSGSATHTGDTCTFTKTFSDTTDNGDWEWQVTASDGTNTSASAQNTFSVQLTPTNGGPADGGDGSGSGSGDAGNYWYVWVIIIVAIIGIIYWVLKK